MDPEVIEIPPPIHSSFKSKQKQVVIHEVIDVDNDEDSADLMILNERVDARNKGKGIRSSSAVYSTIQAQDLVAKALSSVDKVEPSKHSTQGSQNVVDLDYDVSYDDEVFDNYYLNEFMDVDEYAMLQAHFDNFDIPAGVEASVPWFGDISESKKKTSHKKNPFDGSGQSHSSWLSEPAHINKKAASFNGSSFQSPGGPLSHSPAGASLSSPLLPPQVSQSNIKSVTVKPKWGGQNLQFGPSLHPPQAGGWANSSNVSQSNGVILPQPVNQPAYWEPYNSALQKSLGTGSLFNPNFPTSGDLLNHNWFPPPVKTKYSYINHGVSATAPDPVDGAHITPQEVAEIRNRSIVNEEDILRKLRDFKQFDTVDDFSDHHYASNGALTKQPSKNWAKKIQEEWKILEKDLPDTIFVRVYESRMDLLRAVIIGAEGTPYHDGLFFFDVFFPHTYPKVPPHVYYHSGGLRLNPNLYNCGKVCLSLLNTWSGNKNEKWIPGTSTMLQVLVSIQALILNQKPYFNEPGWAPQSGTPRGELMSQQYNEDTFILSLKTMIYSMRRPPKHFKDFVVGHFYKRAHDILVACKAYMDGAQVGCLVKGGVQDVDEGDKSCSKKFKDSVAGCVSVLVKEFTILGAKDCEKFLSVPKSQK